MLLPVPSAKDVRRRVRDELAAGTWRQIELADRAAIDPSQLSRFLQRQDDRGLSPAALHALHQLLEGGPATDGRLPLPPLHAAALAGKLLRGELVLFAGAGFSHQAVHRESRTRRLPLWPQLASRVAEAWGHEDAAAFFPDPFDLLDYILHTEGRARLEQIVQRVLDDRSFGLSLGHVLLDQLPWSAVVTTNHDGLLRQSLAEKPIAREADYDRLEAADPPRLFQLRGTLAEPHTLTRDDHRRWAAAHPRAAAHLRHLVQRKSVLFIGCSPLDPSLTELFASMREWTKGREDWGYAWMWRASPAHVDLVRRRDGIDALTFRGEEEYEIAFAQVIDTLKALRNSERVS